MLSHIKRFIALLKRQSRKLLVSATLSALIVFLCYLMNNCPYPLWDSLEKFSWMEYILSNLPSHEIDTSDALFINVSHDKQIVNVSFNREGTTYTYTPKGLQDGTIDIINRDTLLSFLKKAEKADNYKHIFLDIRFEKDITTKTDSSLLSAQMSRMRNLSYATHSDIKKNELADPTKAVVNDYFTTISNTSFTRYQYLQKNDRESAALSTYISVDTTNHKPIKRWGLFYYSNGQLCQNSPFMRIPEDFGKVASEKYYDLGSELLYGWCDEDWSNRLKDKVVFVGDYENDVHDTYNGKQPFPYLTYLAYKELCEGKHIVSWKSIGFLFTIYVIISLFIMNNKSIWLYIPCIRRSKNKFLLFILDMCGFTTLLSVLTIVLYVWFNNIYNVFFPSLIFSVLSLIFSYKNKSV